MKVKKWLLGFMTFAAMAVLCVVCAGAETYGDFEYSVLSDDKTYELIFETDSEDNLYVYGFKGNAVDVVVPPEVNGKRVTSIGFDAFGGCESLTHIEIPSSVTNIDSYAFRDCTSLTGVEISNSVTSIGEDAFYGC